MIEAKANIESAELLFSKRQEPEDVLEVVVPPKTKKEELCKIEMFFFLKKYLVITKAALIRLKTC